MAKGKGKGKTMSVGTHLAAPGNQKGNFAGKGNAAGGASTVNAGSGDSAARKVVGTHLAPRSGGRGR